MDYMKEALKEAEKAKDLGEVPVGAVIVKDGEIIARGHNRREKLNSVLAHAEIMAINEATKIINNWRLDGCSMYVTLEPCPMCAGAILQCRVSKVYIGTFDPVSGAGGSIINILENDNLNKWTDVKWCYDEKCSSILTDFFKERRKKDM
ncbi:nucleoside deaminase [Clostridium sp.]|uniref:nucleoside deaminase n=1 Tax=Clostridium sp. TaxID=1506 RepID=UPI003463A61E